MTTPSVVDIDPNAPQNLSPIKDYAFGGGEPEWRKSESSRRSRKQVVDEMRTKYKEAKNKIDRMKEESTSNKRMLLEMSSVINALKDISIDYDQDESAASTPIVNVQKKIRAIDNQLRMYMMQCNHLEQEKEMQASTIKAQEGQIRTMELQIEDLQKKLKEKDLVVVVEKDTQNTKEELESTIKAQGKKIALLEDQLRKYSEDKHNNVYRQIEAFRGANEAKYLEITAMDQRLEMLRKAQFDQLSLANSSNQGQQPLTNVSIVHSRALVPFDKTKSRSSDKQSHSSHTSSTSHSSRSGERSSLASISEEETHVSQDEDLYTDDRGSHFSSRSLSADSTISKEEHESHSIEITASHDDESVEIMVKNKDGSIDVSDVSYTTEESMTSKETETVDYEAEYNKAMALVQKLRSENEKLRMNHSQALSDMAQISELTSRAEQTKKKYEETKKALDEQKQSTTLANTKYEKLRREHAKTMEELREMEAKYTQLADDYGKIAHRESDLESFDKLKQIHDAVVMKMADIVEENETLVTERNAARSKQEQAESKNRVLSSELEATTTAYQDLQKESDTWSSKLNKLSLECDEIKTKYYELLAGDASIHTPSTVSHDERYETLRCEYESVVDKLRAMEAKVPSTTKLQRDYAEALAKVAVLEQSNQELENIRDQYHTADARVKMLERQKEEALEKAKAAKKLEEQRASHLKDMLTHYKTLEKEYEGLVKKLDAIAANDESSHGPLSSSPAGPGALADQTKAAGLQSKMAVYERRIKELQQQRDEALRQLNQLEEEISQARLEKVEAHRARKDREQDLKVVLSHYHDLQKKYDALQNKTEKFETTLMADATEHTVNTTLAVLSEQQRANDKEKVPFPVELFETRVESTKQEDRRQLEDQAKEVNTSSSQNSNDVEEVPYVGEILQPTPEPAKQDEPLEKDVSDSSSRPEAPDDEVTGREERTHEPDDKAAHERTIAAEDSKPEEAEKMEGTERPDPDPEVLDEDTVARLMIDMDEMRSLKNAHQAEQDAKGDRTDMSSVSNVSEGLSLDDSVGGGQPAPSVLSDEAPSTGWKDVKIAKLLNELEQAKSQVWALEEKEKSAQAQLETTERKLLVATREAEDARQAKSSREGNLRDAIANQKRIEDDYKQSQDAVKFLQVQLEKAKKEARVAEEETKEARKRAASYHTQFKKLQEKHSEAMKILQEQEQKLKQLGKLQAQK